MIFLPNAIFSNHGNKSFLSNKFTKFWKRGVLYLRFYGNLNYKYQNIYRYLFVYNKKSLFYLKNMLDSLWKKNYGNTESEQESIISIVSFHFIKKTDLKLITKCMIKICFLINTIFLISILFYRVFSSSDQVFFNILKCWMILRNIRVENENTKFFIFDHINF